MTPYQPGVNVPMQPMQIPAQRPSTGLKVLGIIQMVFGVLGLLGAPLSLAVAALNGASKDPLQVKLHDLMWEGAMGAWSYTQIALGVLFAVALFTGGLGLTRAKRWGRTLGLVYSIGTLVMLLTTQLLMFIVVYPMLMEELDSSHNPVMRAGAIGGLAGGLGAAIFGAILPAVTLFVLMRKSTREQLD